MGNIKYTIEEVRKEFENRGYILLDSEYKSVKTKMACIDKDGYMMMSRLSDLKKGQIPNKFNKSNPYTIENIKLWLKLTKLPYTLVSTEYKRNCDKLIFNCPIHGEFKISWDCIQRGQGCSKCNGGTKLTKEDFIKKAKKVHGDKYNYDKVEYKGAHVKVKIYCKECETYFIQEPGYHLHGQGCSNCNTGGGIGQYNSTLAERNKKQWLKKDAIVYFIKCWNDTEKFYKIGITAKTVQRRFGKGHMPYRYEVLREINTNLYDAIYSEEKLHKQHKEYSYTPLIDFKGKTECFSKLILGGN